MGKRTAAAADAGANASKKQRGAAAVAAQQQQQQQLVAGAKQQQSKQQQPSQQKQQQQQQAPAFKNKERVLVLGTRGITYRCASHARVLLAGQHPLGVRGWWSHTEPLAAASLAPRRSTHDVPHRPHCSRPSIPSQVAPPDE
jgi:hypothetical protein